MKRISVCIALSLVMCLCMVFPVSAAAIHKPELAEKIDLGISKILASTQYASVPSSYKYVAYSYYDKDGFQILNAMFFNSSTVSTAKNGVYRLFYNYSTGLAGSYEGGSGFSIEFMESLNPTGYPNFIFFRFYSNAGSLVGTSYAKYYITDRSTAKFYNQSAIYPNVGWELTFKPDISALQTLINTAKSTNDTGYNSDSWQALQSQITAAEIFLNTTGYTQSQVDAQTTALQSALDGLMLAPVLPDTTELQELLVEADKITDTGYTAPTWTRFTNARMAGHNLLARPTYTALDVQTATDELRSSMSGLTLASVNPPVNPPVKPPQDYPATTFESFLGSEYAETYLDMDEGFSLAHLFPAVAGIEENVSEARKFAIWVFVAILGVYITTRILRTVVFVDSVDATGGHEKIFNIGMNDAKRSALASRDDLTKKERASLGSEYQGTYLRQANVGEKYIDW